MSCAGCRGRRFRRFSVCGDRMPREGGSRRGVAVVELAIVLPLIALLFFIALDFGRAFYFSLTLQNCARAGAIYASDPNVADESPFSSAEDAALADATNLKPAPTILTSSGTDSNGRAYVEVTASYPYRMIMQFPGMPNEMNLTRVVRMYDASITPEIE